MRKIEGWKRIAAELGVSEKTAREWAAKHGLPVYDVFGRKHARSNELAAWYAAKTRRHMAVGEHPAAESLKAA